MGEKSPIFPKNLTKKVIIMEKEYLYVGFYTDTEEKFVLKIGTTKDLKRRQGEHNRSYKRAKNHTMPEDGSFQYLWTLPLSKWNTHRFEESNIALWQEMGIGEYVRNDRFILDNVPNFVPVKIRKTYQIALA
jgi:hypothetical protein